MAQAQPDWTPNITFGIALLGAVLGVINTWRALWRDRVRLRVSAVIQTRFARSPDGRERRGVTEFANGLDINPHGVLGVCVTNIGFLEVTISSVGFTPSNVIDRRFRSRIRRLPIMEDAGGVIAFPRIIKPRESITVWAAGTDDQELRVRMKTVARVYASTECGIDAFGNSGLLRALVRRARSLG